MTLIRDILGSKKAVAAMAGVIVGLAAKWGLDLDATSLATILSPIVAYILGQGLADQGKEAASIDQATEAASRR